MGITPKADFFDNEKEYFSICLSQLFLIYDC